MTRHPWYHPNIIHCWPWKLTCLVDSFTRTSMMSPSHVHILISFVESSSNPSFLNSMFRRSVSAPNTQKASTSRKRRDSSLEIHANCARHSIYTWSVPLCNFLAHGSFPSSLTQAADTTKIRPVLFADVTEKILQNALTNPAFYDRQPPRSHPPSSHFYPAMDLVSIECLETLVWRPSLLVHIATA